MYIEGFSITLDVWWRQKYCAYDLFQARSISLFVLLNNAVYSFVYVFFFFWGLRTYSTYRIGYHFEILSSQVDPTKKS